MSNKADLLKQINDAASEYGDRAPSTLSKVDHLNNKRREDQKRIGSMVMGA